MKTLNQLIVFVAIALLTFASCKKDGPKPTADAPIMTGISISGEGLIYDIVIAFNEGVYANNNSTGDLTKESFLLVLNDGSISIESYIVTHAASQKTAKIRMVLNKEPTGNEIISVQPLTGFSIYNFEGVAMNISDKLSIALDGTPHEIINVRDQGEGTGTTTWTSNNIYILDGLVFVNEGQTLTIEPGTVIKGKAGQGENASALIVARGGHIMAEGTFEEPIIFTAEADDLNGSVANLDDGMWGGVILLGKAVINTVPPEQQIEGIPQTEPRGVYGGDNDNDNSGILKYISIRHGGTDIGEGNEINGLTLGAVGDQTIVEYIEVFANRDDGVEIFGGKPSLKNIIVAFCGDDSFDYDQGYHGKGQFWVAVQGFDRGDRLAEHDGGTSPETGLPYSKPVIYNVTYFGRGEDAGKRLVTYRDNAGGHYANSIFYNQQNGVDLEMLVTESSYDRFGENELTLRNNIFFKIGLPMLKVSAGDGVSTEDENAANQQLDDYFYSAANEVLDPGFDIRGTKFAISPTNNVGENMAPLPSDEWFSHVNYKGAIHPDSNWVEGWTLFTKYLAE